MNTRIKLYQVLLELTAEKYLELLEKIDTNLTEQDNQLIYIEALDDAHKTMKEVLFSMR